LFQRRVQGFFSGQSGPNVNGNYRHYPTQIPIENGIAKEILTVNYSNRICLRKNRPFLFLRLPEDPPGGLIQRYGDPPIQAQFGLRLPFPNPKISPHRAPFKNNPNLALFWQTDKIKDSRIAVLRPVFGPGWVFC
jgi:hypothetical protein